MKFFPHVNNDEIVTTHALPFLVAPCEWSREWMKFRVGTVDGGWRSTPEAFEILFLYNSIPGNGHFTDVFEWFEHSCKRDKKSLIIREVWNTSLLVHLLTKRGFSRLGEYDAIKKFDLKSRMKRIKYYGNNNE